jgi:hypothetical protein
MFRSVNIMTPRIIGYYKLRNGYAELATGEGFSGSGLWGVTVKPERGASKPFHSEAAAREYIESLT